MHSGVTAGTARSCGWSRRRTRTAPSCARSTSWRGSEPRSGSRTTPLDAAAREGVAVPSTKRLLDRVHRVVEPDALGDGDRPGVERAGLRCPQSRRRGEDDRVFESYWASGDFVPLRPRRVPRANRTSPSPSTALLLSPSRSCCARSRNGCWSRSSSRAPSVTTGTCSSPRPVPARRSWPRSTTRAFDDAAEGPPALRRAPRGDPRPEPRDVPLTRCATRASASSGSAASDRPVRARLRVDPEPQPLRTRSDRPRVLRRRDRRRVPPRGRAVLPDAARASAAQRAPRA